MVNTITMDSGSPAAGRLYSGIVRTYTSVARVATFSTANLAFSYHGSLRHYTTDPIQRICENQNDTAKLRELLVQFRAGKGEELKFINKAVRTRSFYNASRKQFAS